MTSCNEFLVPGDFHYAILGNLPCVFIKILGYRRVPATTLRVRPGIFKRNFDELEGADLSTSCERHHRNK